MNNYNITLDTELGAKNGTMQICINGNKANGILTLLRHSEPFFGDISSDGTCKLYGKIVTLMKEITFEATGKISKKTLRLNMHLDKSDYVLTGILSEVTN